MRKEAVMKDIDFKELSKNNENISRNGYYPKIVKSDSGEIELNIPRDIEKQVKEIKG